MSTLLFIVSWYVIGLTTGFLITYKFMVKPLEKSLLEMTKRYFQAQKDRLDFLFELVGVPKFDKETDGSMVSPIQFNKRNE